MHVQFFLFVKNNLFVRSYFDDSNPLRIAIDNKNDLIIDYLIYNVYDGEQMMLEENTKEEEENNTDEDNSNNVKNKASDQKSAALKNIKNALSLHQINKHSKEFLDAVIKNRDANNQENNEPVIQESHGNKSSKLPKVFVDEGFDANSSSKERETAPHDESKYNSNNRAEFLIDKGEGRNNISGEGKLP